MTLNHFKKFNPKGKNSNGSETQCSVAVTEHDYNDKQEPTGLPYK